MWGSWGGTSGRRPSVGRPSCRTDLEPELWRIRGRETRSQDVDTSPPATLRNVSTVAQSGEIPLRGEVGPKVVVGSEGPPRDNRGGSSSSFSHPTLLLVHWISLTKVRSPFGVCWSSNSAHKSPKTPWDLAHRLPVMSSSDTGGGELGPGA